ncbi:MAG: hypothetical protein U5N55_06175 [Cypionkella sp.]|nr:hypothetical protein [Cypionkella sp.]
MRYSSFDQFLAKAKAGLAKGPIAIVLAEDDTEVDTTVRHHLDIGFGQLILLADAQLVLPADVEGQIHRVDVQASDAGLLQRCVNRVIEAAPDAWIFYCYNAEYLFFPFLETRQIGEMLAFHMEERREAFLCYVVDIYAENLTDYPNAVSLDTAHMDSVGYYALAREDPANNWAKRDRQLDFYGGLRWRFEEYVPWTRRRIDRIALFRAKPGLILRENFTLSDEEMNTYACPWHNNLTAAIASFRTAKALRANPGSRFAINTFLWQNSVPFEWHSQQLMDMGLIEPGQWF